MGGKLSKRRPQVPERFAKPQGLYPAQHIDFRKLRKLILEGKLAPCYPGQEEASFDLEDCPICFLHYPCLNRSRCCSKGICTECFLQLRSPQGSRPTQCPFCKTLGYAVEFRGAKTLEEKGQEQAEEQKVIEAKIRMQREAEQQARCPPSQGAETPPEYRRITPQLPSPAVSARPLPLPPSTPGLQSRFSSRQTSAVPAGSLTTYNPPPAHNSPPLESLLERVLEQRERLQAASRAFPGQLDVQHLRNEVDWPNMDMDSGEASDPEPDLDDLMLMEAIWQSLQEHELRPRASPGGEAGGPSGEITWSSGEDPPAGSAEVAASSSGTAEMPTRPPPPTAPAGSGPALTISSEISAGSHSPSRSSEAGTSSLWPGLPPGGSSRSPPDVALLSTESLPQSFDEQMALALALSLADVEASQMGGIGEGVPGGLKVGGRSTDGAGSSVSEQAC